MDGFHFQYRTFCDFCGGKHLNDKCQFGNMFSGSSFYEQPILVSNFKGGYYLLTIEDGTMLTVYGMRQNATTK